MTKAKKDTAVDVNRKSATLLFADIKGYSKLKEHELKKFFTDVLPEIAKIVYEHQPFYVNTWGDAIFAAFDISENAAYCSLVLRDYFRNKVWTGIVERELDIRIALHTGEVYLGEDAVRRGPGLVGHQINLAARVEPVTTPGHVWATDTLVKLLNDNKTDGLISKIDWDDLKDRALAKAWGKRHLYRLKRPHEPAIRDNDLKDDSHLSVLYSVFQAGHTICTLLTEDHRCDIRASLFLAKRLGEVDPEIVKKNGLEGYGPDEQVLTITHGIDMEGESDRDLILLLGTGCTGEAWIGNKPSIADLDQKPAAGTPDWKLNEKQEALVSKNVHSIISVPICSTKDCHRRLGVLSFDSSRTALDMKFLRNGKSELVPNMEVSAVFLKLASILGGVLEHISH